MKIETQPLYWHVHHDKLIEPLTEPASIRADYIRTHKSKDEVKLRLQLFKPASNEANQAWAEYEKVKRPALAEYEKVKRTAWAEYEKTIEKLHKKECPNCPWNGVTIFK